MTAPRKLIIAAVALLVCGVIVALWVTRPRSHLTLAFVRLHTNSLGVIAQIKVKNTARDTVEVTIAGGKSVESYSHGPPAFVSIPPFDVAPLKEINRMVFLLPKDKPWRLIAKWQHSYDASLVGRMRFYFERWLPRNPVTLDVP